MAPPLPHPLAVQSAVLALGAALLALTPPAQGDLLLVPLSAGAATRMLPLALAGGARLVARGPWPGSLVVRGRRGAVWRSLTAAGVLVTAAAAAGCGEQAGDDGEY